MRSAAGSAGSATRFGPLRAEAGEGVEVRDLRDRDRACPTGRWRCPRAASRPEDAGQALRLEPAARAPGQVPHEARHEVVGDVAGGDVALEARVVAVRDREVRDRPGQDARVEHRRRGVDELRPGVAHEEREAAREALLHLHLQRVVDRVAHVVAVEAHRVEAREGPHEPAPRGTVAPPSEDDGGTLPKHGFGTRCSSALPERELLDRELVDVRVGHADVRPLRAGVGDLHREVRAQLALARPRSTAARSPSRGRGPRRTRSGRGRRRASRRDRRHRGALRRARRRAGRCRGSAGSRSAGTGTAGCVNGRRDARPARSRRARSPRARPSSRPSW